MKTSLFIALVGLLTLAACKQDPGILITEERSLPSFTALELGGAGKVLITQDTTYAIRIEAGDRLMNYIETEVTNGKLRIWERSNRFHNWKPVRYFVSAAYLDRIVLAGSGEITGNDFQTQDLELILAGSGRIYVAADPAHTRAEITGSGQIDVTGATQTLDLRITGSGEFECRSFISDTTDVTITGSGRAVVNTTEALFAKISGSGDIWYYGNPPVVETNISGSGTIQRK